MSAEYDSPATDLLLARLLLRADVESIKRAKSLLLGILEKAKTTPEKAEISVVLASIETLGWGQLNKALPNALPDALSEYGRLVADFIMSSTSRGFDQALVSFAAIGRALRYHDEELFMSVLQTLGHVAPVDARDDKERAAWGHIYLSAADVRGCDNADAYATFALEFYDSLKRQDNFVFQQKGHCLFRLSRFKEACEILEPLVRTEPNPWNRYWLSKALCELGDLNQAITLIDEALAEPKAESYRATLLEHRYEIRKKRGDQKAIEDLQQAHHICQDGKHKGSLANKLRTEASH